jgi:hypothetical protein
VLIEYKIVFGRFGVAVSQRVEPCSTNGSIYRPQEEGPTVWRSLGRSYDEGLEAPGGSGLESTSPGGSGLESTAPGGSGLDSTAPGGSGLDSTAPGGSGLDPTAPGGSGLDPTAPGGTGLESTGPGGGAPGSRPVIIFGPIVLWV